MTLNGRQTASFLDKSAFILLCVLTCECAIGSSGRWLEIGPLSVRMILFIVALLTALPLIIYNMRALLHHSVTVMLLVFACFTCYSIIRGACQGNTPENIIEDVKPFVFLLIVPGYMTVINNEKRLTALIKSVSYASLVLAFVTVALHFALVLMDKEDIIRLNVWINSMELGGLFDFGDGINRIYFRSSIFFIVPFLYNLSLIIRKEKTESKFNFAPYLFMSVPMCAIIITYTRSIWLGVLIAFVGFTILNRKHIRKITKSVGFTAISVLVFVFLSWAAYGFEGVIYNAVSRISFDSEQEALENSDSEYEFDQRLTVIESDITRKERLQALTEDIGQNWIWGYGFGDKVKVDGFEIKTEYTYLEILRKMGIFGSLTFLAMLLVPLIMVTRRRTAEGAPADMFAVVAGAILCIAAASIFNPYLTSPLGFSIYGVLTSGALLAERFPKAIRYRQIVPASARTVASEQQDAM